MMNTHTHACTHACTYTHTHIYKHTQINTHTCTNKHTYMKYVNSDCSYGHCWRHHSLCQWNKRKGGVGGGGGLPSKHCRVRKQLKAVMTKLFIFLIGFSCVFKLSRGSVQQKVSLLSAFCHITTMFLGWLVKCMWKMLVVFNGQICIDDCPCCHSEIEIADQTCSLTHVFWWADQTCSLTHVFWWADQTCSLTHVFC